jgi:multiple sugar transport system permease protein/putative aldouronate transport system permease protein
LLWPVEPSLLGYETIFRYSAIWQGYANTIFYTVAGTAISLVLTLVMAYPLSRKDFKLRNIIMIGVTFSMLFSGGMIPTYLIVKATKLLDTRWALLIPNAITSINVIITRTYYQSTISSELLEASQLDGCTDFRFFLRVVLPLSGAITATNVLLYAVAQWNNYFNAMLYINSTSLFPLQIILRKILILNSVDNEVLFNFRQRALQANLKELLKYALIVVSTVPMLVLYPFCQKYFVKGVMIGSIKG